MSKYPQISVADKKIAATRFCFWASSIQDLDALPKGFAPSVIVLDFPIQGTLAQNKTLQSYRDLGSSLFVITTPREASDFDADGLLINSIETLKEALKYKKLNIIFGPTKSRDTAMQAAELGADAILFHSPHLPITTFDKSLAMALWWNETIETRCILYVPSQEDLNPLNQDELDFIALNRSFIEKT